jgi:hypothetical protein
MQGAMRQRVIINWGISSFFGWGVYGLNLAMNWLDDPDVEPMCAIPIVEDEIVLDPLQRRVLDPFFQLSANLHRNLQYARMAGHCHAECPVLTWLDMGPACLDSQMSGSPTFGVVFFETAALGADPLARAKETPPCSTQRHAATCSATGFAFSVAASWNTAKAKTSFWRRSEFSPDAIRKRCWSPLGTAPGRTWPARSINRPSPARSPSPPRAA